MTYNYSLALSKMDSKRFVHFKVCCCMFFFFFLSHVHQRTKGTVISDCTVRTVFVSVLFHYFIHHPPSLCLWGRCWRDKAFQPLLSCMSGSIVGEPDCQWTQTATEVLAQPWWILRPLTTSHLQQWLSVFRKFQLNSQTEINCREGVVYSICVCVSECASFFFKYDWACLLLAVTQLICPLTPA